MTSWIPVARVEMARGLSTFPLQQPLLPSDLGLLSPSTEIAASPAKQVPRMCSTNSASISRHLSMSCNSRLMRWEFVFALHRCFIQPCDMWDQCDVVSKFQLFSIYSVHSAIPLEHHINYWVLVNPLYEHAFPRPSLC